METRDVLERARHFSECQARCYDATSHGFPSEAFASIGKAELLGAALATEFGGAGLDLGGGNTLALLKLLEYMGYADLSVGRLYEGHINAIQLIQQFGTRAQIEQAAYNVHHDGMVYAVWNTDADDAARLIPTGKGYRLEGGKSFASGAGDVQRPLITAELPNGGKQMVVVRTEAAMTRIDAEWWQPIGMENSTSYHIDFSGTRVEPSDLIGESDDYHRQPWFFGGAIRFSVVQLGGAKALFDAMRRHLQKLDRTGDPYQRQRAGRLAALIESGDNWLRSTAELFDCTGAEHLERDADRIVAYVHMARSAIEQICLEVLDLCIRSVGAQGLATAGRFQQIVRDLTLYLRQPAPDAAQAGAGAYALEKQGSLFDLWSRSEPRHARADEDDR